MVQFNVKIGRGRGKKSCHKKGRKILFWEWSNWARKLQKIWSQKTAILLFFSEWSNSARKLIWGGRGHKIWSGERKSLNIILGPNFSIQSLPGPNFLKSSILEAYASSELLRTRFLRILPRWRSYNFAKHSSILHICLFFRIVCMEKIIQVLTSI